LIRPRRDEEELRSEKPRVVLEALLSHTTFSRVSESKGEKPIGRQAWKRSNGRNPSRHKHFAMQKANNHAGSADQTGQPTGSSMEKVTKGMLVLFFSEKAREMGLRERDGEKGREEGREREREREKDGKQTT